MHIHDLNLCRTILYQSCNLTQNLTLSKKYNTILLTSLKLLKIINNVGNGGYLIFVAMVLICIHFLCIELALSPT